MKFFVSWTSRDPCFQDYDSECNIIVSPVNVPLYWTVSKWKKLPNELFIDSGAFSTKIERLPSCQEVLQRQLFMSTGWPSEKKIFFSHPDLLIPPKIHFEETTRIITQSLERAKIYFDLISKARTQAVPIGVIHGFDEETLLNTYFELRDIGYQFFALGSLSIRFSTNRNICFKTLEIAQRYGIKPLHLFGITWPFNHDNLFWEVNSFDTSAPAKLAFYGTVLYGPPLRRYVIRPTPLQRFHDKCFTFRESLSEPIPCICPICKQNSEDLFLKNDSEAKKYRVIHNYFQVKWEIESRLSHGPGLSS